ncbi:hypothetical protein HDV06_005456 [Boothiomyces sp. JEL0866]|nr:hypothetical protein HDV06_005456 [Boothiomyces sp. JEL0866]
MSEQQLQKVGLAILSCKEDSLNYTYEYLPEHEKYIQSKTLIRSFNTLEKHLLQVSTKLSEQLSSKRILIEYKKDPYGVLNNSDDRCIRTMSTFQYNTYVYYLQEPTKQVVLNIGTFDAQDRARKFEMTPQSNFFAGF